MKIFLEKLFWSIYGLICIPYTVLAFFPQFWPTKILRFVSTILNVDVSKNIFLRFTVLDFLIFKFSFLVIIFLFRLKNFKIMWQSLGKKTLALISCIYISFLVFRFFVFLGHYQFVFTLGFGALLMIFPLFFNKRGFSNPTQISNTPNSFYLEGEKGSKLPINNPQAGIFIVGNPGCGKTKFAIEPILYQMISKGYSGILYDYDFSSEGKTMDYSLSTFAYNCWKQWSPEDLKFFSINFSEVHLSARVNPVHPNFISKSDLGGLVEILLKNLDEQKQQDFWDKNTNLLLVSILIFLHNTFPEYCTIPHAICIGYLPVKDLSEILKYDEEACQYAGSFLDSTASPNQLSGVCSSFKVAFRSLLNRNIVWVLSGNDLPFVVNDMKKPFIVSIGNNPKNKSAYSPPIAMIISMLVSQMYGHGRSKSFIMIDELPTVYLPTLNEIPATARKYKISTVTALQNFAQLEKTYSSIGAKEIQETFGNKIIGKSELSVSKYVSDMFGEKEVELSSYTFSKGKVSSESETKHERRKRILNPEEIINLGVGEFVGKVCESDKSLFKMKLTPAESYDSKINWKKFEGLPETPFKEKDIEENYLKIKGEVKTLLLKLKEEKIKKEKIKEEKIKEEKIKEEKIKEEKIKEEKPKEAKIKEEKPKKAKRKKVKIKKAVNAIIQQPELEF